MSIFDALSTLIAIRTFGDFFNSHPHCHVLCTDGTCYGPGSFKEAPALDTEPLGKIFQHKVLGMLFGSLLFVLKLVVPCQSNHLLTVDFLSVIQAMHLAG
jgi:hypothetical protein